MTVVVDDQGQILRTSGGNDLVSGGPFQQTLSGRNAIARSSVPFATWGATGLTLIGGRTVAYTQLYRTQPYVAAAVDVLTRQIARLPLKVYRLNSQGDRERVREHRLVDLIERPAPRCNAAQLKQWLALPVLLHGNATLLKARTERAGPPTKLWPLDWRYMQPSVVSECSSEGALVEFWKTSEFGDSFLLDPADVLHLHWEAPDSPIGVSPLQQLGVTVRIEQAAQAYQESYLEKGARPPSAIKAPEGAKLDADLRAEIRADLDDVYGGPSNAGRPAFLPQGFDWVSMAHTAHEAELIAQRKLTREEVATVYHVPQPMVGILDHATYSNVAELHRMLFTTVLGAPLTLIEETFQAQVIDPEPSFQGLFVEFDLAEVLKGDKLKEINALKLAVQSGLMTINEARSVLNLPTFDLEWCDGPLIPANNLDSEPGAAGGDGTGNGNGGGNAAALRELARALQS